MSGDHALERQGTLERGLAILRHVALEKEISTNAIATQLGLSRSATYRTVNLLKELGYLEADQDTGWVRLGIQSVELGVRALSGADLHKTAAPVLRALAQDTAETVYLAVPDGDGIVYVAREQGPNIVVLHGQVGVRVPLHASSAGKAWLAALPPAERADRIDTLVLSRLTPNTITDRDRLVTDIDQVEQRGWAIDNVESTPEVGCVAAAVRDHTGRPVAALSVAGPAGRVLLHVDRLGAAVARAAGAVSLGLGHVPL